MDVDRIIHEPARLHIISILNAVEQVDFLFLLGETGLTRGNLSTHLTRLEEAGYIQVTKTYRGKVPQTLYRITTAGAEAFRLYRKTMKDIMG
jgi:DNA-binding MarR family transcriptional regulator